MRRFFIAVVTFALLPFVALAQQADRPNTILVLDASGSMWGQIDGVNKIVIARDVIAEMLAEMPDETSLGLTVYGHRERGSCTDIETIVSPAPFTQDRILEAVNSINPRGRTPMADAVVAAAQSLRHTENPATVILVSDGIENCNPDPCAMARELEAAGIGFTAHVIGFDVAAEPEARAQMQCIAEGTGGMFLTADNAAELGAALQTVVAAQPTPMRLEARVDETDTLVTRPVSWRIIGEGNTIVADGLQGATVDFSFDAGLYTIEATRTEPSGPGTYSTNVVIEEGQTDLIILRMPQIVDPSLVTFTARVEPDMSVPASPLDWTLYDAAGAVLLGPVEAPGGNVQLLPGDYRLSVLRRTQGTTHEARFTVTQNQPQEVVIPLPALLVDVTFTARLDSPEGEVITDPVVWDVEPVMSNPATSNPATVQLTRGAYRVTAYWTAQEVEQTADFVIVDQPREIVVVFEAPLPQATLTAPETAVAGSTVEVGWTGPDAQNDYLGVGAQGAEGSDRWQNFTYTRDGNPASLTMPMEPGPHLITYFLDDGRTPIATVPITVTPAAASLTAPPTATAGSTIEVGWTGPDYRNDYIGIGAADATGSDRWENFAYTRDGSPASLLVPTEPGAYIIRYFADQDRTPLAEVPITVTEVLASITAPDTATAGSTIEVGWTGPDNRNDYIGIGAVGADGSDRWQNFTYTERGNPVELLVPTEPGAYVIRYFLDQDRVAIAEAPITVTEVAASITAPPTATAGATIDVGWTGPDNRNDYIGIGAAGADGSDRWENFTYTERGNPAQLVMPTEPGAYVIRYFLDQDRVAIAEAPITVTAVAASITAPPTAIAGSTVEIGWTGPDYRSDYIGIGAAGADGSDRWENFAYTERGNPAQLVMPVEPGAYVIRYFMDQDRVAIAEVPITVTAVTATLSTKDPVAAAGTVIEVEWTGPDYRSDYIGIGPAGATGSDRWERFVYTERGNPAELQLPEAPGAYVIRYFMDQDRTPIAELPITLR
jgi:Ca-activated chloride channel family protein